ncbi:Membrane-associated guanylate kinase, WW and PDZ domain-containing protein 1 [Hondaea fermentalgiana]|uniref:NADH dehydrogenase [ubiquinone] iron-sulfur protein 5 n=1 Tax=Hondaea fermentalgiana TaxID=2315210 RepID=A0A2R5G0Y3_9STRA|nr:Membrane-associated guanylate kinase, WW and PDZ domain-containing protein 1 [Hondaea fermentalgiana]|eukprot:GBG24677.1 Membrane-associated guanylate kinase, WW and PDZ domain-containing protein 1 [Hondaea fermentalgiana]
MAADLHAGGGGGGGAGAEDGEDGARSSKMEAATRLCTRVRDPVDGRELRPADAYAQSEGVIFGSRASQQRYFDLLEEGIEVVFTNGQPRERPLERATLWTRDVALRGKASKQQFIVAPVLAAGAYVFTVRSQLDERFLQRRRKASVEIQVLDASGSRVVLRKTLVLDKRHPHQRADFTVELEDEGSMMLATFTGTSFIKPVNLRAEVTCLETPEFVRRTAKARRRSRSLLKDQEYVVEIVKDASGMGMSLCWNERAACALVSSLARHGPADQTSMIEVGDHLRSIQGVRVDNISFREQLRMIRDAPKYLVLVLREGSPRVHLDRASSFDVGDLRDAGRLTHHKTSSSAVSMSLPSKGSLTSASSPELADGTESAKSSVSSAQGPEAHAILAPTPNHKCADKDGPAADEESRVCAVCMQGDAVAPSSLSCGAGHLICADCINGFVTFASSVGNEAQLGPDNQSLRCVIPDCPADPISAFELAQYISQEDFQDLLRAGLRSHEQAVLQAERDRQELKDSAIQKHVNYVANEILTLKCPRNGHPFFDFDGCLALTCTRCRPQCYFCAWCLKDCGQFSHSHVMRCQASPRPGVFYASLAEVHQLRATHSDVLGPMASGFGFKTPTGRCHGFYIDLAECMKAEEDTTKCRPIREDYFECLHHRKEFAHRDAVAKELRKRGGVIPPPEEPAKPEASE